MKPDVIIDKVNDTYIKIRTDTSIEKHIYETFSFTTPKMKYHPKVKARLWDGYIHLYNYNTKQIYLGLLEDLVKFFNKFNYSYQFTFSKIDNYDEELLNEAKKLIEPKYELMDHQKEIIDFSIKNNRGVIISATSSGKSLSIYALVMYYLLKEKNKILIVVPRTSLCEQMKKDFIEYHNGDKESFSEEIDVIYNGSKRNDGHIKICTWQSLQNFEKEYFSDIDVIMVDECHNSKAKELTNILELCSNAPHKFGFTGTLSNKDDIDVNEMVLRGLFGRTKEFITSKELIDRGHASQTTITCIKLNYSNKSVCDHVMKGTEAIRNIKNYTEKRKKLYENEIEYIINSKTRNSYVSEFALKTKGNTIVMFHYEEHGKKLFETISSKAEEYGKQVYLIYGNVKTSVRENIRDITEKNENVIIVASYGTTAVGVNIKRLHNMILAGGFKGEIVTRQTIGRMLRLHEDKDCARIYDIGDDFSQGKSNKNFSYVHFLKRVEIYREQQFDIKAHEYQIESKNGKLDD